MVITISGSESVSKAQKTCISIVNFTHLIDFNDKQSNMKGSLPKLGTIFEMCMFTREYSYVTSTEHL